MSVGREGGEREQAIDLTRLIAGIRRRRRWVVRPTILALGASSIFVLVVSPRYTGVAKVLLEDQESYFTKPDKASGFDPAATIDQEAVQSQAEAVASGDLARKAIDRLGLGTNPEFNPDHDGTVDQRVVDKFLSRLAVFPVPRSRVLQIEFVSRAPELAARGANTVAEVYLQSQTEAKANAARAASAWLSGKIEDLRAKVADADARVEDLRARSGLLTGANGQTVPAQQLSELNAQLANARSAEAAATAKAELLRRLEAQGRLDEAPESVSDESMRRSVEQRTALRAQFAEASRTLLPLHPRMKELSAQLAALDSQIRDAAAKNVRVFENDARLAADQVSSLSTAIKEQSRTVATGNADDVRLRALEMDAKAARDQLESYLQKYREAAARDADSGSPANARVIATAEPPRTPTFPKVWQTIVLATLAAFVVSSSVAGSAALTAGETEAAGASIALSPPQAIAGDAASFQEKGCEQPKPPDPLPPAKKSRPLESVDEATIEPSQSDALAERLMRSRTPEGRLAALIVGNGSGRALTVALETARRLSTKGATLLVDLGATQDWLTDILEREETDAAEVPGLADLLKGNASFGEVIRRDLSSGLDVIPSGGDANGERLEDVLAALTSAYGCVVFHASDWRSTPARLAAGFTDAIVLIAPAAVLRRVADEARDALGAAARILPFALTRPQSALEKVA
ncbi:MAG: lipopolysaccharide biosynthesis protein [Hyphomicrobiales bacterium]|nr:lipopolysaccharide biosynthesis protein [Hyphomicrobiales bacterium]MBV8441438.1 lipopolysaccharide biosynthesis protein [Hyphomicrobiales bacterium]